MQVKNVLKLSSGHSLSFPFNGTTKQVVLADIDSIVIGPGLEKFSIKFRDENDQEWSLSEATKDLKWVTMPKRLPMAKEFFSDPAEDAFVLDDANSLVNEMIKHGLDKKIVVKATKSLAMKLDGENDALELICWRLFGKYDV